MPSRKTGPDSKEKKFKNNPGNSYNLFMLHHTKYAHHHDDVAVVIVANV